VIEHVKVAELPEAWRNKIAKPGDCTRDGAHRGRSLCADCERSRCWRRPLVRDVSAHREDMADLDGYIRKLRAPRYNRDGSRNEDQARVKTDADRFGGVGVAHARTLRVRRSVYAKFNPWRISAVTYIELAQGCRNKAELERLKKGLAQRGDTDHRDSRKPSASARCSSSISTP